MDWSNFWRKVVTRNVGLPLSEQSSMIAFLDRFEYSDTGVQDAGLLSTRFDYLANDVIRITVKAR